MPRRDLEIPGQRANRDRVGRAPGTKATRSSTSPRGKTTFTPPRFELDQHVFFWLTQVIERRDRQLTIELKPYGLRVPEWRVLASLYSRHRASMSVIADLAAIDRTTLSRTIDRMVGAGLVARSSDAADMRVTRLALTIAGERLFERIWPVVSQLNGAARANLPEPVISLVFWALKEMRRNLDRSLSAATTEMANRRAAA